MIFGLWKSRGTDAKSVASIPENLRLYVVGDVHGRADLVERLAGKIAGEMADAPEKVLTLFLGDYIDRGMRSSDVVARLSARDFPTEIETLRGNHEQAMLEAFDDERVFDFWRKIGGLETLASYKIDVTLVRLGQNYSGARADLQKRVPSRHIDFLNNLPVTKQIGDYFFCHAGVKPRIPLDRQQVNDLISIRDEFLNSRIDHGKVVVHGHTPVEEPDFRPNRINIDTGAYLTNRLTCLVLQGASRRILEA
jgi:serine/threonine protein phosphatase 1